jgi:glucosamine-6-phosphate deaminase
MRSFQVDQLPVEVHATQAAMAEAVTQEVHAYLVDLLARQDSVRAILATGNSQIAFLKALAARGGIDWSRVTLFHMDEYLGLSGDHPASFRLYMKTRVEQEVHPKAFHYLIGDALEPIAECERYDALLQEAPIDLCCMGVGENGHIAFNDPPVANFADRRWVKIVQLDEACKLQQVNEGHFPDLEAVPKYALSLTIPALVSARKVICVAPETRKSRAIATALEGPVSTDCPASYLRNVPAAKLFLDEDSAALLKNH